MLLITNIFQVTGDLLRNTLHKYLVEMKPPFSTQHVHQRRNIVLGGSGSHKMKNTATLCLTMQKLFSLGRGGNKVPGQQRRAAALRHAQGQVSVARLGLNLLRRHPRHVIDVAEEEQLLNSFKRKAMFNACFNLVGMPNSCRTLA